ncbi:MAG: dienelactone hydrolase family protein [Burkholderiales bacterium]|jgi:carboxymethylenebutenolidase|nr:dienelactone hydrolase family protein [Burkholderiales bacterium]
MNTVKTPDTLENQDWISLYPNQPFSRRRFVVTSLSAGFALATQPIIAQTAVKTDATRLIAGDLNIPVADGEMPAYAARPQEDDKNKTGKKLPTILVIQEIFGVHEYIKDICRRFAKLGYLAIAPELYARYGDPRHYTNVQLLMSELVAKVPDKEVMADLDAAAAWAGTHGGDADKLAVTGFCWGGRATWLYCAHRPHLKAGIAWYGRLSGGATDNTPKQPIECVDQLKAPVLGLYGGQDPGIPLETVDQMKDALKKSTNKNANQSTIVVYPDAPHAFHADYRPSFRRAEAEDGWTRLVAWLAQHGMR